MTPVDPSSANRSRVKQDAPVVVTDPAIQAMVKRGILKAREKLIDLSLRNGMLSFRHSETSGRHVRIVDATLEFLVASLASGSSLDIVPLPPVEQIPRDEDTDKFRAALKAAKEVDPEWLVAEDRGAPRGTGGEAAIGPLNVHCATACGHNWVCQNGAPQLIQKSGLKN